MSRKLKVLLLAALALGFLVAAIIYLTSANLAVLQPEGQIGQKERNLILLALGLSAVVVIPVYVMLVSFAWRYREGNKKAKYRPEFDHSRLIEGIWWGVPLIIITILSVATWTSSHQLDPFKPLDSDAKPVTIQVVALQWKWLFIYPEENIASVNYVQFPQKTPVEFEITSDSPMNSFWIPKLGGQIYAMSGMSTSLHLMANKAGVYNGSSANISGKGFARMTFVARSSSKNDFEQWSAKIKESSSKLSAESYQSLSKPNTNNAVKYYSPVERNIFNQIIAKYVHPGYFHNNGESI